MQRRLTEYIRRPETLDAQAIPLLRDRLDRFPYNHTARILLLQALHRLHDPAFDAELRRSAPLIPDRQALFRLIEEKNYRQDPLRLRFTLPHEQDNQIAEESTEQLINDFLSSIPQQPVPKQRTVDASQDYIEYMLLNDEEEAPQQTLPSVDEQGIIDEFLLKETGHILLADDADESEEEDTYSKPEDDENEILTESLAHIYIKQGKFEKAIEIIRRLSLKYPKKNRYFADQIRFLEKLVINNKHK